MGLFYEWAIDLPTLWLLIGTLFLYMSVIFIVAYNFDRLTVKRSICERSLTKNILSLVVPKLIFECFFIVRRKIPSRKDRHKSTDEEHAFLYVFS